MSDDNTFIDVLTESPETTKTTKTTKKITKKITIDKIMKIISLILPLCIPATAIIAGSPAEFIPPNVCEEIEYILESSE